MLSSEDVKFLNHILEYGHLYDLEPNTVYNVDDLLKEQHAVEKIGCQFPSVQPKFHHSGSIGYWVCGDCGQRIGADDNFCPHCGIKIERGESDD